MAKTPMKNSPFSGLMKQIDWGMKNSRGGIGGMAAMLGVPFQQKRGGNWMTIDPRSQSVYLSGTTPPNGMGGGGPQIEDPALPPFDPNDPNGDGSGNGGKFAWTFPQYSQSWAFTPPEPTPYPYPQPFDPKKYGDPFKK
jgi:hypothetical protein